MTTGGWTAVDDRRSPFADPAARLRTGIVVTERLAVRDGRGAAVSVGWSREGRRRFVELRTGKTEPPSLGEPEEARDVPGGWRIRCRCPPAPCPNCSPTPGRW
ncbi:hypothetical protein [Streptomyces iranensis]|uniref:hypothetical protein n=1 Tax=Streptomyces iranensis TaxID=576784 RepID=UPI0039B76D0D